MYLAKLEAIHGNRLEIICSIVGGNDTYGITGIPTTVGGHEVVERAGLGASTKIVYPGSGRKDT